MARADTDQMDQAPKRPCAPRLGPAQVSGIPATEPVAAPVGQQIVSIRARIAELEDSFRYMGTAHPHYESVRTHIALLREMLRTVEGVLESSD